MIVILSPIANENIKGVNAAVNNLNLKIYSDVMRDIAISQKVGFVDLFSVTEKAMKSKNNDFFYPQRSPKQSSLKSNHLFFLSCGSFIKQQEIWQP